MPHITKRQSKELETSSVHLTFKPIWRLSNFLSKEVNMNTQFLRRDPFAKFQLKVLDMKVNGSKQQMSDKAEASKFGPTDHVMKDFGKMEWHGVQED